MVHIIGAGLSDRAVDLPLSTLSVLARADVVLHDALSLPEEEIWRIVPDGCVVRSVGKRGGIDGSSKQEDIDDMLVRYAVMDDGDNDGALGGGSRTEGARVVVRLKGGDPFLFGRSRTEIDALREKSVAYRVVPNLSSCVAGPHYGGIPLTDPSMGAQSFAVFSGTDARGRGRGEDARRDWQELDVDTLIFLMIGRLDKLDRLCESIGVKGGERWDEQMPCAVVQNAGRASQRVWRATLGTIFGAIKADLGADATTVSPSIFIVGPTASLNLLEQ